MKITVARANFPEFTERGGLVRKVLAPRSQGSFPNEALGGIDVYSYSVATGRVPTRRHRHGSVPESDAMVLHRVDVDLEPCDGARIVESTGDLSRLFDASPLCVLRHLILEPEVHDPNRMGRPSTSGATPS